MKSRGDERMLHVVPGPVISVSDGDTHYISGPRLAQLYGLKRTEWRSCMHHPYCNHPTAIHLFPRSDGNYADALIAELEKGGK